jgi:hypothetical protein
MKGFGIEIKNDLLDPKHLEHMGQAVWLSKDEFLKRLGAKIAASK